MATIARAPRWTRCCRSCPWPDFSSGLTDNSVRDRMREAIDRAHRSGLLVIGQQVEDPQAAATLWMSGIDFIQGNLVQEAAGDLEFDFQHSVL